MYLTSMRPHPAQVDTWNEKVGKLQEEKLRALDLIEEKLASKQISTSQAEELIAKQHAASGGISAANCVCSKYSASRFLKRFGLSNRAVTLLVRTSFNSCIQTLLLPFPSQTVRPDIAASQLSIF